MLLALLNVFVIACVGASVPRVSCDFAVGNRVMSLCVRYYREGLFVSEPLPSDAVVSYPSRWRSYSGVGATVSEVDNDVGAYGFNSLSFFYKDQPLLVTQTSVVNPIGHLGATSECVVRSVWHEGLSALALDCSSSELSPDLTAVGGSVPLVINHFSRGRYVLMMVPTASPTREPSLVPTNVPQGPYTLTYGLAHCTRWSTDACFFISLAAPLTFCLPMLQCAGKIGVGGPCEFCSDHFGYYPSHPLFHKFEMQDMPNEFNVTFDNNVIPINVSALPNYCAKYDGLSPFVHWPVGTHPQDFFSPSELGPTNFSGAMECPGGASPYSQVHISASSDAAYLRFSVFNIFVLANGYPPSCANVLLEYTSSEGPTTFEFNIEFDPMVGLDNGFFITPSLRDETSMHVTTCGTPPFVNDFPL